MPARLRPPTSEDAPAVLDVILARDVADLGVPDFTLEDLRADWAAPDVDLQHDARVAGNGATLDGYALLIGDDAHVAVHPGAEGRGTGTVLRRWAEARAAERGTTVLRQFAHGANQGARRLLRAAGYAPTQHYYRLRVELSAVPDPPDLPLRVFAPADGAAVHALVQEAFAEVEGFTPGPLRGKEGLLLEDDEGLAGAVLGERWENGTGYVAELAVAPRARGRGFGRALLLAIFAAFRRAGLTHGELSVHGRNRGALRLYEGLGMRAVSESERWEKSLGRA